MRHIGLFAAFAFILVISAEARQIPPTALLRERQLNPRLKTDASFRPVAVAAAAEARVTALPMANALHEDDDPSRIFALPSRGIGSIGPTSRSLRPGAKRTAWLAMQELLGSVVPCLRLRQPLGPCRLEGLGAERTR